MPSRRDLLTNTARLAIGGAILQGCRDKADGGAVPQVAGTASLLSALESEALAASTRGQYQPCIAPGIKTLSFEWVDGVKVFRLRAEPVRLSFPDTSDPMGTARRPINAWGYNGSSPGPTIECVEGDRVRIIFENGLNEPTTVHWHGLHIPLEMDGVPGISQPPVKPGDTFIYEFTLEQHGTYFYHSHVMQAKQVGLGMMGFFIVHPRNPEPWQIVDRDYAYFLHTWMIHPGSANPDTTEMVDFNFFTMNGSTGHNIVPMQARLGERVRIRVSNLSMLVHPIHLHGHTFVITDWGAGFLPQHMHIPANTINVSSAEVRVMDFKASRLGKWLFHCHFTHHTMDDMHRRPIPGAGGGHEGHMNMDAGGMHTYIEITE